ncbi:Rne/Rng family ribonuclease [Alkalibacter rhizosphaerae]|uniref:Rne/Rng family ribonuclease n=1 Tax=Alkalibacter rhizosphaerae TaxID=2815577 RepID=A0A974XEG6_9FIRM|nr:Rne/Rng family ribonuclease [Alkalibacter rhizosphaerae]QSX08196.1 Rne/Rng family ribonuclease [Alkalibacter rhizosphaerae]
MSSIVIENLLGQNRIAVVGHGADAPLDHFFIERHSDWNSYGEIYIGRVDQIKAGMQVAFLDIGADKNGLLHASDILPNPDKLPIEKLLKNGQEVLVQVKKEAVGTKGARLTTKFWLTGHYLVLLPTEDRIFVSKKIKSKKQVEVFEELLADPIQDRYGVIVRTEAKEADPEAVLRELAYLIRQWEKISRPIHKAPKLLFKDQGPIINTIRDYYSSAETEEIILNNNTHLEEIQTYFRSYFPDDLDKIRMAGQLNVFEELNLEKKISELYARKVWLKSGGSVVIDTTEACTVVDVNSGKYTGKKDPEETILKINLEATETIANQIRLRNISGIILIDYINIEREDHKNAVIKRWKELSYKDKVRFQVVGFTELSILQITRKQQGKSVADLNRQICPMCNGTGDIYSQEAFFYKCLSKIEHDMSLLEHNRYRIVISPHLYQVVKEMNYFQAGKTFDRMLEEYYKVKVYLEVDLSNEFDQVFILPVIDN